MSRTREWRVVDAGGQPVDEGLDVAWVVYETRAEAETTRRRMDEEHDGGPHRIEGRDVGPWRGPKA